MPLKILTVVGARPQFIKASVLNRLFLNSSDFEEIIVHTGQHYDDNMSNIFFNEMGIQKPHYNLNIQSKHHGEMTGLMMAEIEKIALIENPQCILVYGDTNSTLAGALVASKLHIKLAHVEAGLRSFNNFMPEEINRILTDRISNILFCPTQNAYNNLLNEGFQSFHDKKVVLSGDIMYDASLYYANQVQANESSKDFGKFVLCTIHRAENTDNDEKISTSFSSLDILGKEITVILPLHPRTKAKLQNLLGNFEIKFPNIKFLNPVGYLDMISFINECTFVITDSGGLQKEAFFMKKMCITLRDQTEWIELVDNGYNILCGISEFDIIQNCHKVLTVNVNFNKNLYGNGSCGEIILNELTSFLL